MDESKYIYTYPGMHQYQGMVLPNVFPERSIRDLEYFEFKQGDVVVDSYPKSGKVQFLSSQLISAF